MGYHFAFMAISLAVFGSTVGSLVVFAFPKFFEVERLKERLEIAALSFAVSTVLSFLFQINTPFAPHLRFLGVCSTLLFFLVASAPFFFAGICISLALTKVPKHVSEIYAADLCGATIGCLMYVAALSITDAPTVVFLVAATASLGAVFYSLGAPKSRWRAVSYACCLISCLYVAVNTVLVWNQRPIVRLAWSGSTRELPSLYEKWSPTCRIVVRGDPNALRPPFQWGAVSSAATARQLMLYTDGWCATALPYFAGRLEDVAYLKSDVTNIVNYIKSDARVLIVGSGGGRDILSALLFGQKHVTGVEINDAILDAGNRVFGDFTGHLDKNPRVKIVNDDARSYLARTRDVFDIIEISIVNTSSGAGAAHALTENSIYTVEAWKTFIDRLDDRGMLSCTRFFRDECPGEIYRMTSLAVRALQEAKIDDPRAHLLIVVGPPAGKASFHLRTATFVLSKQPIAQGDLSKIARIADQNCFHVLLSPNESHDPILEKIVSCNNPSALAAQLPLRIDPPTDDCPFFFYMFSLHNLLHWSPIAGPSLFGYNYAQIILTMMTLVVLILALLCILVPLLLLRRNADSFKNTPPYLAFFAALGFGFITIEISQMQRLSVFLGHPSLGISVGLFTLLLGSSVGSFITKRWSGAAVPAALKTCQILVVVSLISVGVLTPAMIEIFRPCETLARILIAAALLFPAGVFMGMPFPLCTKLANAQVPSSTPWLWSVNGATTVCGSVLAIALAVYVGISMAFWFGVLAYCCAFVSSLAIIARFERPVLEQPNAVQEMAVASP